ncbi:MAG: phosphatidate cytidylyltransferase [Mesorhizobium sp.]
MNQTFLTVLGGIAALLALATAIGAVLARRAVEPGATATVQNLNARIRSWWVMVIVLGGALALGDTTTIVLFALLSFLALREFWTLTPSRRGDHLALFLSFFVVLPYHYFLLAIDWYGMFVIFIPVYAFLLLPAVATITGETDDFLARSAKVQWGLMLTVYSVSHAPALLMLDAGVPSALLISYLVIVVQISDVLQYVWGKLIGKHRFSPNISPSKTVEGLVGGGLSAILVGTLLYPLTPFSPLQAAAISAVVVVAGFFGGFVLSAIKRDLKAKDWGHIIEGHGGVLDRVDSLTFAAPLFFHITRYWFTT